VTSRFLCNLHCSRPISSGDTWPQSQRSGRNHAMRSHCHRDDLQHEILSTVQIEFWTTFELLNFPSLGPQWHAVAFNLSLYYTHVYDLSSVKYTTATDYEGLTSLALVLKYTPEGNLGTSISLGLTREAMVYTEIEAGTLDMSMRTCKVYYSIG